MKNLSTTFDLEMYYVIAETPRLIIREFLLREEEIYLNHFNDPEVCQYIPQRTREERVNIFLSALVNYISNKQLGIWGMFDKVTGEFVGSCLLRFFNNELDKIELGYSLEKKYWGKGIASEMATAMVAYAFEHNEAAEVVAVTDVANVGSQRVLEKAGLIRVENIVKEGVELAFFKKIG